MRFGVTSLIDLIVLHSSVGSPTGLNVARVLAVVVVLNAIS